MKISITHCDCLDQQKGMPSLEANSFDMILCDLPYSMTKNHWDQRIDMTLLWQQYTRLIKNNGVICLFANQPFTSELVLECPKMFRYSLVWEKNKFSDFLNCKRKPLKIHEDILIFYKKQPVYNPQWGCGDPYVRWNKQAAVDKQTNYGKIKENVVVNTDGKRYPTTVLKFNRVETPVHPTQKPVDLCEWLIKTYTTEDSLVLDNCFGSGSTAVACTLTNRNFVGFEKDEKYFDAALSRLDEITKDNEAVQVEVQRDSINTNEPTPLY